MGCEGCLLTEKEKQQKIKTVESEAKIYAVEHQTLVVLYWAGDQQLLFKTAEAARIEGVIPFRFVSFL